LLRSLSSWLLSIFKDEDATASLGNLFQFDHPPSRGAVEEYYFLIFRWNSLYFSLCPLPLAFEESLALPSLFPPINYLYTLMRPPPPQAFSRLNSPVCLSLSSYIRCSSSLIAFVASFWACFSPCFSCTWKPRTGPSSADVSHQCCTEEEDHLP